MCCAIYTAHVKMNVDFGGTVSYITQRFRALKRKANVIIPAADAKSQLNSNWI